VPVSLVFEIAGPEADELSDRLLELGASSVSIEDAAAGTAGERPMFDEPGSVPEPWSMYRLRLLADDERLGRDLLARACLDTAIEVPARVSVEPVEDLDWVRATQAQFPAIRVASRLWIVPSWQSAPDASAINVILDPGRAFGTGSHPTTLLCLEWLERAVRGGETVLDYGCGSGILAIAACLLGAAHVIGVDIDEQAVETARANAASNGVTCEFMTAHTPVSVQSDLIVANILANPLIVLAPALAPMARPGGRIALSGILAGQFAEVARAYEPYFKLDPPSERDGWVRISGTRQAQ
jgi:ribosomal protein L11 methyltransferase